MLESLRRNRDMGGDIEQRLRRVMLRLVHVGENAEATPDARAVALRPDFRAQDWALVLRLAEERLMMIGQSPATGEETAEVVHEALIGAWHRLRGWIDEDRLFKLWQQRLTVDLKRWSGKPEDAVLHGRVLAEATSWLASHRHELNASEVGFIEASRDNAAREAEEDLRQAREREDLANKLADESRKLAEESRKLAEEQQRALVEQQEKLAAAERAENLAVRLAQERQAALEQTFRSASSMRLRNRLMMAALALVILALAAAGYGYSESVRQAQRALESVRGVMRDCRAF